MSYDVEEFGMYYFGKKEIIVGHLLRKCGKCAHRCQKCLKFYVLVPKFCVHICKVCSTFSITRVEVREINGTLTFTLHSEETHEYKFKCER